MTAPPISELEFLYRTAFTRGNANGVVDCVWVTVCRAKDGTRYLIPDDPERLADLLRMLRGEPL